MPPAPRDASSPRVSCAGAAHRRRASEPRQPGTHVSRVAVLSLARLGLAGDGTRACATSPWLFGVPALCLNVCRSISDRVLKDPDRVRGFLLLFLPSVFTFGKFVITHKSGSESIILTNSALVFLVNKPSVRANVRSARRQTHP
jgi:hypothetical protein